MPSFPHRISILVRWFLRRHFLNVQGIGHNLAGMAFFIADAAAGTQLRMNPHGSGGDGAGGAVTPAVFAADTAGNDSISFFFGHRMFPLVIF